MAGDSPNLLRAANAAMIASPVEIIQTHYLLVLLLDTVSIALIIKTGGRRSVSISAKAPDDYRGFRAPVVGQFDFLELKSVTAP